MLLVRGRMLEGAGVALEAVYKRLRGWSGVGPLRWPLTARSGASAGLAVLTRSVKNLAPGGASRGGGLAYEKQ